MVNAVQEIIAALRTVYPAAAYDIYTEQVEQGFTPPCFFIRQIRTDVTAYPVGRYKMAQHLDVHFFPVEGRPQEQCRKAAETLSLLLQRTENLRGLDISWEITDDVLHFFVSYPQFVRDWFEEPSMESMQHTTKAGGS